VNHLEGDVHEDEPVILGAHAEEEGEDEAERRDPHEGGQGQRASRGGRGEQGQQEHQWRQRQLHGAHHPAAHARRQRLAAAPVAPQQRVQHDRRRRLTARPCRVVVVVVARRCHAHGVHWLIFRPSVAPVNVEMMWQMKHLKCKAF